MKIKKWNKPHDLKQFIEDRVEIKEAWFYRGTSPSFHVILKDGQAIHITLPHQFSLRLNKRHCLYAKMRNI